MRLRGAPVVAWLGPLLLAVGAGADWGVGRADDDHLRDTSVPSATCLSCHTFYRSHRVDVDYGKAVLNPRFGLRPEAEVVRRGLFLPGGRVVCHTCHDFNSPWQARIVIPPGSKVSPRVVPGEPSTFERAGIPARTMTVEEAKVSLPKGTALGAKPLCLVCHAQD